jgi:hypothetical protein
MTATGRPELDLLAETNRAFELPFSWPTGATMLLASCAWVGAVAAPVVSTSEPGSGLAIAFWSSGRSTS